MAELRVKSTGTLKLFENDNTSSVTIASPASLGADRTVTLPDADVTLVSGTMSTGFAAADITGQTALGATPADTDEFVLSDAGVLKRVDYSYIKAANTPFIFVRNSATQAITTGTATKVTFDTEIVDSDGEFASDKWTCVTAGRYFFNVALEMQSMTDAKENWLKIYKNGGAMIPTFTQFSGAGGYSNVASIMINADASDYFEIYVLQNNGNDRNVNAEGCVWSIIRIIE